MLYIKTNIKNINWLKYILSEFKKTNKAFFDIEIDNSSSQIKSRNVIYYCNSKKRSIFNSNQPTPSREVIYIKKDLFVLKGTVGSDSEINFDIFWNAFVFLSRYEEFLSDKKGKSIKSYCFNHPRKCKKSFHIPIVNALFNELEFYIKKKFKFLNFGNQSKPIFDFSHDVDYIKKTIQLRLKQTVLNSMKTSRLIFQPKQFSCSAIQTVKFLFGSSDYWCFDYWTEIEKKYGVKSIFYVYAKTGRRGLKSWLLDPSYDILSNIKLNKKIIKLKKEGFDIGLHGSFRSAHNYEQLKREKILLEEALGFEVTRTRQHWLNYSEQITPFCHNSLFETDSSLGWNDRVGFRSGIANKYAPYDFKNNRPFSYEIVPQIIMDSTLYDYSLNSDIFNRAKNLLELSVAATKCTHVSISWHQRVRSSDYKWHHFYELLLEKTKDLLN